MPRFGDFDTQRSCLFRSQQFVRCPFSKRYSVNEIADDVNGVVLLCDLMDTDDIGVS